MVGKAFPESGHTAFVLRRSGRRGASPARVSRGSRAVGRFQPIPAASKDQQKAWQAGSPSDWAKESFQVAKDDAYGQLPEPTVAGMALSV
jgi:hypothetical protein